MNMMYPNLKNEPEYTGYLTYDEWLAEKSRFNKNAKNWFYFFNINLLIMFIPTDIILYILVITFLIFASLMLIPEDNCCIGCMYNNSSYVCEECESYQYE